MPQTNPTANSISIDSTPPYAAAGIASSASPRPQLAAITIGSLRTRSISTPACRLTSANGSVSSATRMPICIGVADSITAAVSGSARLVICAPKAVIVIDDHSFMNSGSRQRPVNRRANVLRTVAMILPVLVLRSGNAGRRRTLRRKH